ncbi:MAG: hypothetical protein ACFB16_19020 [Phormidesmis sp.]
MSRIKRQSAILALAEERLHGMMAISTKLDLGGGCTTATMQAKINEVRDLLKAYHLILTQADDLSNKFEDAEKELAKLSKKVLKGVAVQFDEDSSEYEMVGGVRTSERKRSRRSSAQAATV